MKKYVVEYIETYQDQDMVYLVMELYGQKQHNPNIYDFTQKQHNPKHSTTNISNLGKYSNSNYMIL